MIRKRLKVLKVNLNECDNVSLMHKSIEEKLGFKECNEFLMEAINGI